MPRGGWLHEVRRWACCGLRRTGGPSPGSGAFSSSPYTVPLCWVWGPSIAVLWSCQRIEMCVTVFAFFTYLLKKEERCVTVFACYSSSSSSSLAFCTCIQPELRALSKELEPFDGGAKAIMDDVYVFGPAAQAVFPAIERLAPQRKTRRFTGDREFGVATASRIVQVAIGFAIGSIVGAATAP